VRTKILGALLSIAALLGDLSLAPLHARDAQATGPRDSVVPILVIDAAAQGAVDRAERSAGQSGAGADDAGPAFNVTDNPADVWAAVADVPVMAWLLLGTCVLCARFGFRTLRRFEGDTQGSASTEPEQTRSLRKTTLNRPWRSPG
jgi:hypothetical protein